MVEIPFRIVFSHKFGTIFFCLFNILGNNCNNCNNGHNDSHNSNNGNNSSNNSSYYNCCNNHRRYNCEFKFVKRKISECSFFGSVAMFYKCICPRNVITSMKSIKIILKCSFTLIESHTAIKWAHCNRVKKFIFIFS